MAETPDDLRKQLDSIEARYNSLLELLQMIAAEKGDEAASDPDYIQYYTDATALNEQFEALQARLATIEEASDASPVPVLDVAIAVEEAPGHPPAPVPPVEAVPEVPVAPAHESPVEAPVPEPAFIAGPGAGDEIPAPPAPVAPEDPGDASIEVPPPVTHPVDSVPAQAASVEPVKEAPPEPKYITVERTRVEETRVHEQSWSFVGISSTVPPAVADLAGKGGYVTENVLEKQFGPVTFLLPFPVDSPVGMMVSQVNKRAGKNAGMIVYPVDGLTTQTTSNINQVLQALLASRAPKNHVVVLIKPVRTAPSTDKISIIVGGLGDQDARLKQSLESKFSKDAVYFDNDMFYKGQLLDEIKAFTAKIGLRLVTMVCTAPVVQSFDHIQTLVESF